MAEFFELCSDGTHLEEVGRRLASLGDEERVAAVRQGNPDQVGRTVCPNDFFTCTSSL